MLIKWERAEKDLLSIFCNINMICTLFAVGPALCKIKNFANSKVNQKVGGGAVTLSARSILYISVALAPFVRLNFARAQKGKSHGRDLIKAKQRGLLFQQQSIN